MNKMIFLSLIFICLLIYLSQSSVDISNNSSQMVYISEDLDTKQINPNPSIAFIILENDSIAFSHCFRYKISGDKLVKIKYIGPIKIKIVLIDLNNGLIKHPVGKSYLNFLQYHKASKSTYRIFDSNFMNVTNYEKLQIMLALDKKLNKK